MNKLLQIKGKLESQDNRITVNPMFCVQEKVVITGMDTDYTDNYLWLDCDEHREVEEDTEGAYKVGYFEYWKTVMVAFTEAGCTEYLRQNGHNLNDPRIYVESFNRCPEMIAIREYIMAMEESSCAICGKEPNQMTNKCTTCGNNVRLTERNGIPQCVLSGAIPSAVFSTCESYNRANREEIHANRHITTI